MNLIFPALFTVCFNPNTELVSYFIIFLEEKISTSLHEEKKLNPKLIFLYLYSFFSYTIPSYVCNMKQSENKNKKLFQKMLKLITLIICFSFVEECLDKVKNIYNLFPMGATNSRRQLEYMLRYQQLQEIAGVHAQVSTTPRDSWNTCSGINNSKR